MRTREDLIVYALYGRYLGKGVMVRRYEDEAAWYGVLTAINDSVIDGGGWLFEINNERIYQPAWLEGVSK